MNIVGRSIRLAFLIALGLGGIAFARHAFIAGMTAVVASETSAAPNTLLPEPYDTDCVLGPMSGRAINVNRCRAEARRIEEAREDEQKAPARQLEAFRSDDNRAALWFGATSAAILLSLGGIGAAAMWLLRE